MTYNDGQDFVEFISRLRTKWSNATAIGAKIDDLAFRMIILNALPRSWDSIVATLYNTHSSREAINHLMTHWARVSHDCVVDPRNATAALCVSSGTSPSSSYNSNINHGGLVCSNHIVIGGDIQSRTVIGLEVERLDSSPQFWKA
jgi:hypothetical protein